MLMIKNNLTCILAVVTLSCCGSIAYAVDKYPENTVKILIKYKTQMVKVEQAREKLTKMAKHTAMVNLSKEMTQLTQAADLDRAIAARDLMRVLKKGENLPEISTEDKKYRQNSVNIVNTYKKRIIQVNSYLQKKKSKIIGELTTDLNDEMLEMDKDGFIAESLTIKQLLEKIKAPSFNLAKYSFAVQKEPPKKVVKKPAKKTVKKSEINYDELIPKTALALGNNILSDDITAEKGLIYVCFAESINARGDQVPVIRQKIEKNLFLSILPCSMSEGDFLKMLEKQIRKILAERPNHQDVLKYCALLCHFKPALKKDKEIAAFVAKSGKPNSIAPILGYSKEMFGGSTAADDIRLQIKKNDSTLVAKLLARAKQLQAKYPKNQDVTELVKDLSEIKVAVKAKITPTAVTATFIDCKECGGTGWVDIPCPTCKGKGAYQICEKCIGSGFCYTQVECDACKGKGKNWLGIECKKCHGKGTVKVKKVCPYCKGTGKKICPECKNKGTVRQQCPVCKGQGKVKK